MAPGATWSPLGHYPSGGGLLGPRRGHLPSLRRLISAGWHPVPSWEQPTSFSSLPPVLLTNPQARAKRCPAGQAPSGLSCTLGSCPPLLCLLCPGAKTLLGQPARCSKLISKHMASTAWRPVAPQLAPPLRAGRGAGKGLPLVALAHSSAIPLPLLLLPLGSSGPARVSEEHSQCGPPWDGKS